MAPAPCKIALCAIVKDEVDGILEWIAYHHVIGVERFLIFDNGSTDGTRDLLESLARRLPLEVIDWPSPKSVGPFSYTELYPVFTRSGDYPIADWSKFAPLSPQMAAYNYALQLCAGSVEWMMFVDADEFFVPHRTSTIGQFLDGFEDPSISCICINERYFGSSGHAAPDGRLVIERFTRCAEPGFDGHLHVKSIVKVAAADRMLIHAGTLKSGRFADDLGRAVELNFYGTSNRISFEAAQINHYSVKSRAEFVKKVLRGRANVADDHPDKFEDVTGNYFDRQDRNECEDRSIQRYSAQLHHAIKHLTDA